jgi:hypothetical protein
MHCSKAHVKNSESKGRQLTKKRSKTFHLRFLKVNFGPKKQKLKKNYLEALKHKGFALSGL